MHALLLHLHSAKTILARVEEEGDSLCMNLLSQTVSNIEYTIQKIKECVSIAKTTKKVIAFLDSAEVDYTLLLFLQAQTSTKGSRFYSLISYLRGICEQLGAPWYNNRFFYDAVWAHLKREGIRPLTPSKFITNRRKEDILHEYQGIRASNAWGQHNAFFFQTFITTSDKKGFQKLVFFITRTWRDGVIRMLEILKQGGFVFGTSMFDAHGVFEHAVDDEAVTLLNLDCEILTSAFRGHKTADEIAKEMLEFPSIIATEMVAKDLLFEEETLRVTVKDKTRPRGQSDTKVSFHFLLSICARKADHKLVIEECLSDYKERITQSLVYLKENQHLPEERQLQTAWYTFDAKAAISNGFTTPFSLKNRSDPHSRKHSDVAICAGLEISRELCPVQVQDLHGMHLTDTDRLWLLQEQLFTTPKRYMLCYARQFVDEASGFFSFIQ